VATITTPGGTYKELRIPLLGLYQAENAALAVAAIDGLRSRGWEISNGELRNGLAHTRWPGRLEIIDRDPIVLIDGAHNPAGLERSLATVKSLAKERPLVIVFGRHEGQRPAFDAGAPAGNRRTGDLFADRLASGGGTR